MLCKNINLKLMKNERGSALIIAISLLAIMSVLGAILMSTSSTEIQLSGNYRNSQQSFYATDRAAEYARTAAASLDDEIDLYTDTDALGNLHRDNIRVASDNSGLENTSSATDSRNTVQYVRTSSPPVGSGTDVTAFDARYYFIHTVGLSSTTANNPSRTSIQRQVAIVVPNNN